MTARTMLRPIAVAMIAWGLAACAPTWHVPAPAAGTPGGHLLLIGGGKRPDDVMQKFVDLGGGAAGRFVVLPLASDLADTGTFYIDVLRRYGARDIIVIPIDDRRDAERAAFVETVRGASAIFFPGGDQVRIASRLVGTPLLAAIREVRARGGVIAGTSAGTACQSEIMIVGGEPPAYPRRGAVRVTRGLGLVTDAIIDQHFIARGRHDRLLSVVLENPTKVGLGIDEGTAAWFRPDGTIEVMGVGAIVVFDARGAAIHTGDGGRLTAEPLRERLARSGEIIDLRPGAPAVPAP